MKTTKKTKKATKSSTKKTSKAPVKKVMKTAPVSKAPKPSPKPVHAPVKMVQPAAPAPTPVLSKMPKKKLDEFRKMLMKKKNDLIQEAVQSVGDLTEVQEVLPDMTDQASAEMERNFMLRIKDRERKLIFKINEVLARIDDGTYGVCEICGDLINEERLKARPETTQCIECKTDMEEQERRAAM